MGTKKPQAVDNLGQLSAVSGPILTCTSWNHTQTLGGFMCIAMGFAWGVLTDGQEKGPKPYLIGNDTYNL